MSVELNNKYGSIDLNKDIIVKMAGKVANECYGVVGISQGVPQGVIRMMRKKGAGGITVDLVEGAIMLRIHVEILYGVNIAAVAENIMDNVKYQLENQLGVAIGRVDVVVDDIKEGV